MNSQDKQQRLAQLNQRLSTLPATYCVLPFMHATAEVDAQLSPCCRYRHDNNSVKRTVKDFDIWWTQDQAVMREELMSGHRHTGCTNCWNDEDAGISSYRQDCNEMFMDQVGLAEPLDRPVFWMMGIGNYCNIRCIMCSPHRSTNWAVEYEQHQQQFKQINIEFTGYPRGNWSDADLAPLDTLAPHAQMIHFSGGEPFMTRDYKRVLRSVIDPSKTVLHINSNLTDIDDEWMELLPQFQTSVNVSLEGVGEFNDYIRYGSRWADIDRNIDRLLAIGVDVGVTHAFGRTSLHTLPALLDYCVSKGIHITFTPLRWPQHLSIDSAPPHEKIKFKKYIFHYQWRYRDLLGFHRVQEFVRNMDAESYNKELDRKFWQYIDLLDQLHEMNYRELLNAKQA